MANNTLIGTSSTWTTASNWSTGAAPVNGDVVFLTSSSIVINAGLNNATVAPGGLNVFMDFTGRVGVTGTSNQYLQIASAAVTIGLPPVGGQSAVGSLLFNLDVGTTSSTINVLNSAAQGTTAGQAPIKLLGSALTVNLTGGVISIAALPSENATINTLSVVASGSGVSPQAYLGPACRMGTLSQSSGNVVSYSQQLVTSATISKGGRLLHEGTGGFSALTVNSGSSVNYVGSGSVNALTLTGTIDLSGGGGTVIFGSVVFLPGAVFNDPMGRASFATTPTLSGCSRDQIAVNLGVGRYL